MPVLKGIGRGKASLLLNANDELALFLFAVPESTTLTPLRFQNASSNTSWPIKLFTNVSSFYETKNPAYGMPLSPHRCTIRNILREMHPNIDWACLHS